MNEMIVEKKIKLRDNKTMPFLICFSGFVIRQNPLRAIIVKIDPGSTFTVTAPSLLVITLHPHPVESQNMKVLKHIKDVQFASTSQSEIEWKKLNFNQQNRLLNTIKEGIKILEDEKLVDFILKRNGEFGFGFIDHLLMTTKLENKYKGEMRFLLEMQKKSYLKVPIGDVNESMSTLMEEYMKSAGQQPYDLYMIGMIEQPLKERILKKKKKEKKCELFSSFFMHLH